MNRCLLFGISLLIFVLLGFMLLPSIFRSESSVKKVAQSLLQDQFARGEVRGNTFTLTSVTKTGLDWIVTWRSTTATKAEVGVTMTLFDADVWGNPMLPDCKMQLERTVAAFGQICLTDR